LDHLVPPHGGVLVTLLADERRAAEIRGESRDWPSLSLSQRQLCDLELLMGGGFSPLIGFMGKTDHQSVCARMRLRDNTFWPLPTTLDVSEQMAGILTPGDDLALRDPEGVLLAVLKVQEIWQPDRVIEAQALFGSATHDNPTVARHLEQTPPFSISGPVEGVQMPVHYDYRELRLNPSELRRSFARLGWRKVLAFQTHQTIHRAQQAATLLKVKELGANLLIHPLVGHAQDGDADHHTRVRCYIELLAHYPKYLARLSLLSYSSRSGGPREALLQAILHKNHGCSHFMIDHDGTTSVLESRGAPRFDPLEAQALAAEHAGDLEIEMVSCPEMVYHEHRRCYVHVSEVPADGVVRRMGGAEIRRRLGDGRELPEWFTFPGVERELRRRHPPRHAQGFTVFFTGLSGSGKSTMANALRVKLLELGGRGVTLLDGDLVRRNLSSELGFSKEHRDINIRRIGFVASEITRAGGVAICAPIAPYDTTRAQVRELVEPCGGFILVHVSTPLAVCEARDRKGIYAKARAGVIKEFTGVSDPYEVPKNAELVIDTSDLTPEEGTREIVLYLEREGYISATAEEERR
jgi:sulfate adenylyltransferase